MILRQNVNKSGAKLVKRIETTKFFRQNVTKRCILYLLCIKIRFITTKTAELTPLPLRYYSAATPLIVR